MIRIIPSDRLLVMYLLFSGITYIGLLMNNQFGVYFGLMLFIVFTTYVLSWYLLMTITILYTQLLFSQDRVELIIGTSSTIGIKLVSKIPLRPMVRLALIHSPHVLTSTQEIRINGGEYAVKLIGRWIGVARIIYSIATLEEPLGLLTIQGMLSSDGVNIVIRPRSTHETGSGVSIGGYTELGTTMEGRLGDLRSLIEYDYEKPASMIHWLTSARVNELMMISRGDYGSCPVFIMNASSRILVPKNGKRPIDDMLQMIYDSLHQCTEAKVVLVGRNYVEERTISRGMISFLEYSVRTKIINDMNMNDLAVDMPSYFLIYVKRGDLLDIAYIRSSLNDEPTIEDINRAMNLVGTRNRVVLLGINLGPGVGDTR
ncbi:hypothetical protein [Vulcanisaeta souniana]|uniref:DUF58 domain-containing protein n=1 Tax=Vulcanisaeta souniana JCM 11219 TaxID=1293586 RepID=A0A830E9A9_9CREN|nr:hypothetical protein [Vulcanisaeta souniana]BDR92771.1 hypothetical protein Vsou_18640 [Vulcanisaeta souniana JCM 11219]GGI82233.1 hypothetical protein GCM10007112_18750 [Vulcanisaeta souniana JCM 11219]